MTEDCLEGARTLREYLKDPELPGHVLDVLKSECEARARREVAAVGQQ